MARRVVRTVIDFARLVLRVSDRFGVEVATTWLQTITGYRDAISDRRLIAALRTGDAAQVEAVIDPIALRERLATNMQATFLRIIRTTGSSAAQILSDQAGIRTSFNATHPGVVKAAREQAAQLVVGVPDLVKDIIAETIAAGARRGLTADQMARSIRNFIGLPPNWAQAADNFSVELQSGDISAALSRKLSAALKQQIRSRVIAGTLDDTFIQSAAQQYAATLTNLRAKTIARTETIRASHIGLQEDWKQTRDAGNLPQTVRQVWIVTEDDKLCPICGAIPGMNPNGQQLGDPFFTPEGLVYAPPAPHPNCRCSLGLSFVVGGT